MVGAADGAYMRVELLGSGEFEGSFNRMYIDNLDLDGQSEMMPSDDLKLCKKTFVKRSHCLGLKHFLRCHKFSITGCWSGPMARTLFH